ncbi:MAG: hypothetical protein IIX63_03620 [Treponema sp.]|jgi:hypothetical protein|nr:hypothetical protein [Treponema sp.]MBQ2233740.1 hypothetical protein [Treponema sp.]MBQ5646913.1 hypothetical protein [Treponema sp.]MBQ5847597.1 hypothetical protein [Treponema sp.]MEE1058135.1 hypothetical protein [Treponema sp.]
MDFSTLVEKFRYLIEENKKQTIFVCSILIFMTLCGFFVLLLSTSQQEKKETKVINQKNLVIDQELLIPNELTINNKYTHVRQKKEKWSEEEANEWFTVPDETEIEKLSQSNDKIVKDIIGAAP